MTESDQRWSDSLRLFPDYEHDSLNQLRVKTKDFEGTSGQ